MSGSSVFARIRAIAGKEWLQMRRDRTTMMMMAMLPIMQLLLFGYAINTDPRNLPTAVELRDTGPAARAILAAMEASDYFSIEAIAAGPEGASKMLRQGKALFVVTVPDNFERDLAAGRGPQILLDADATDPVATGAASGAFAQIVAQATEPYLPDRSAPAEVIGAESKQPQAIVHKRYNPAGRTALNIVPGLLGVILTMTMMLMTAIALTRERERGTLESLLASPARPAEVMAGKTLPFIAMGAAQSVLMVVLANLLFGVPLSWDYAAFFVTTALFVLVNLLIGFFFSTIAQTQLQAMQMTFMTLLPSVMLSGFMFPFDGMPVWAQWIGNAIPNTHFTVVVRAVMLKDASFTDMAPHMLAILGIGVVISFASMLRYRNTLD